MLIRIEATDLPGRSCGPGGDFPGYEGIQVGVQRRNKPGELLDLTPGDAPSAVWTLECRATVRADGVDVLGPYVQGGPGGRFVYLSWGVVERPGSFAMFRRAKLMIADVDPDVLAAAARGGLLVGRLGLTDAKGNPLCARVRPPAIAWCAPAP